MGDMSDSIVDNIKSRSGARSRIEFTDDCFRILDAWLRDEIGITGVAEFVGTHTKNTSKKDGKGRVTHNIAMQHLVQYAHEAARRGILLMNIDSLQ